MLLFSKIKPRDFTSLACLVKGLCIHPKTGQSCWVLAYSDLPMTLFSGMFYEDQNTSMTWPSVLPTGWSMEWEPSTSYGSDEWCLVWAYHDITPTMSIHNRVLLSAVELFSYSLFMWNFSSFCQNKTVRAKASAY